MDISTLSRLFGYMPGHVYEYTGSTPAGQDPYGYITGLFVSKVGDNGIATNIIEAAGKTFFYSPVEATVSGFTYLSPMVIPTPPVEEPAEEPAQEEQQSEGGE